jgi:hypothetical protein
VLQTRTIWQNSKFYPQLITVQEGSKDAQGNSALGQTDPGAGAYPLAPLDPQASGGQGLRWD